MDKIKVLFAADFSITKKDILDNAYLFEKYNAQVEVVDIDLGNTEEERAAYILKIEKEGPGSIHTSPELLDKVRDAEILITDFGAVGRDVIEAGIHLKLIGVLRSGVENVDTQAASERNIPVINAPGRVAAAVADYTVGMMIAEARNICRSSLTANGGAWKIRFSNFPYSHNLEGKTVGIIGFGAIGQMVAARLVPFGVKLLTYEPYLPVEKIREAGAQPVPLEELLRVSDYVTIHARLCRDTEKMMGREQFALMKPTAFFINTARAGLVDEVALTEVLAEHKIGGAALDVFAREPISADDPLLKLDNVTLTPHLAGTTSNVGHNSIAVILKDLDCYFNGKPMRNIKNKVTGW
ncbi:MAG: 2-hydroxyacid dehydrogenase [Eubacteriales bacterium]|nr:2-hydroxyacid dehydrogenase [Eubacteriales bacterium]